MAKKEKPKKKVKKNELRKQSFSLIMEDYFFSMEASFDIFCLLADPIKEKSKKNMFELLEIFETIKKTKNKLDPKVLINHLPKMVQWRKDAYAAQFVPASLFIGMVTRYESVLGSILRKMMVDSPKSLDEQIDKRLITKDEQYNFKISNYGSIGALRDYLIDRVIENILRSSRNKQMISIYNIAGYKEAPKFYTLPEFTEISARRDIIVHNGSLVSDLYLQKCNNVDYKFIKKPSVGQKLGISKQYFNRAYEILLEVGLVLTYQIWIKTKPEELDEAIAALNNMYIVELIKKEKYETVKNIIDHVLKERSKIPSFILPPLLINKLQVLKWMDNKKEFDKLISAEKILTKKPQLDVKLVMKVLRDDYKSAAKLMLKAPITQKDYNEWPIFKEFRKDSNFKLSYKQKFNSEYV